MFDVILNKIITIIKLIKHKIYLIKKRFKKKKNNYKIL